VKFVLKQYAELLPKDHTPIDGKDDIDVMILGKSKYYYDQLLCKKSESSCNAFCKSYITIDYNIDNYEEVYKHKIVNIVDRKIAQFNYKVLNNTLVCLKYLCKWNEELSSNCSDYNAEHSVFHMLYECQHSVYIWKIVESRLRQKLAKKDIFTGIASQNKNDQPCIKNIVSELQHLLYKFWLLTYKGKLESTKCHFQSL